MIFGNFILGGFGILMSNVSHKLCQYFDIWKKTTGGVWTMRWLDAASEAIWGGCICVYLNSICQYNVAVFVVICSVICAFVPYCISSFLHSQCAQDLGNGSLLLFSPAPLLNIGCICIGNAFVLALYLSPAPPTLKNCHQSIFQVVQCSGALVQGSTDLSKSLLHTFIST